MQRTNETDQSDLLDPSAYGEIDEAHSDGNSHNDDGSSRGFFRWKNAYRNYAAVAILFAVNLLNYMDRFTIASVLTDVQSFYNMTDAEAGLLQTVFICSYMVFAPFCGYLGDRYSRKYIMAGGIFVWSASVLSSTFIPANAKGVFLLFRGIVGIGEASYSTVAPTIIADLFRSNQRSKMLMIFYFAIPVGSGLGFVVGSNIANWTGHWQWGVRITPILGVVALILILFVLQEPERGQADGGGGQAAADANERMPVNVAGGNAVDQEVAVLSGCQVWIQDIQELAKNQTYVLITAGFTCVAFVAGCLSWWTPNFVIYSVEMQTGPAASGTKSHINLVFGGVMCFSGFLGVGLGGTISQRWRAVNPRADPLVCAIGLLAATPFLFMGLVLTNITLPLTWVFMFLSVTLVSLNWSIVSDILLYITIPRRRATASAIQILISHLLGDAFSPYLVGIVSDAIRGDIATYSQHFISLQYALFIPAFVLVLGGLFFFWASNHVQADRQKAQMATKGLDSSTMVNGEHSRSQIA